MNYFVVIVSEAEEQLRGIHEWWRANRASGQTEFLDEFSQAIELIAQMPHIGSPFRRATHPGTRRMLLRRTKHWVYYYPDDDRSVV